MPHRTRSTLQMLAPIAIVALIGLTIPVRAHTVDCGGKSGIDLAHCERHQKMATKCGPIKGEAHFVCDREFLLANPLECSAHAGDDAKKCEAERAAFKTCTPKEGREFLVCVRNEVKASPMGG